MSSYEEEENSHVTEQEVEEEEAHEGSQAGTHDESEHLIEGEFGENFDEEDDAAGVGDMGEMKAEINVVSFEELRLSGDHCAEALEAWRSFINAAHSREAAGEAIYSALFEGAPSLQSLFTTPRAVQAMRFMSGLNSFVTALDDPPNLKVLVETLGFGHLNLDVTVPRVVIFRDAILDLFQVELGDRFTTMAFEGWKALLNYVGGAIIYIKSHYADRLRILSESWKICTAKQDDDKFANLMSADMGHRQEKAEKAEKEKGKSNKAKSKKKATNKGHDGEELENGSGSGPKGAETMMQNVPTTYHEMFMFNAAVMGFGQSLWMNEVLACFDNIVTNVANSSRLQEECDVLVLRISKVAVKVNLAEYKSCMLASLRSLLPKDWSTQHEIAWSWMWDNVEKLIVKTMGQPPTWERVLGKFLSSLDESQAFEFRAAVYAKFFALAPSGQDFFKQSNTYLHLIAIKIMEMTIDMYRDPVRMTDDISALGLRHVGYAIPTELFGPFVTACIEVLGTITTDNTLIEAFRWSIGLISKSLVRTIMEGSTIVMKAINVNTKIQMRKAISCAPRGERATWMLVVQVGTQSISPLAWSIEAGSLEAASAIIQDLLCVRADRDRYYYGAEELFKRHGDIVKKLLDNAPLLLPELLDGLVWRSRLAINGTRRVNYYLKHLLIDQDGNFHPTLEWIAKDMDPMLVCHPMLILLSDLVWNRIACSAFLLKKSWFLFTLVVFVISQSYLDKRADDHSEDGHITEEGVQIAIFSFRIFIYVLSMGHMIVTHSKKIFSSYRAKKTFKVGCVAVPQYFDNWQEVGSLTLMCFLLVMLVTEPIFTCWNDNGGYQFNHICDGSSKTRKFPYSFFSMLSMFLYFILLIDMAVMNNSISAFVLVCARMLSELGLFVVATLVIILMFSSALSTLKADVVEFQGIHVGSWHLYEVIFGIFSVEKYDALHKEGVMLACVWIFIIVNVVFLLNMLIAQLSCAYDAIYTDMVGFARLKRIKIIIESMPSVSERRWNRFVSTLHLDQKLEFNEGDVGLPGGIQVTEPASANPTTVDKIKRYGGSTHPENQWPAEDLGDDTDKFNRLEKLIQKTLSRLTKGTGKRHKRGGMSSSGITSGFGTSGSGGSGASESLGGSEAGGSQGDD